MKRIALGVEYDGAAFSGWQMQAHARSVQAEVERALSRVAAHPVRVTCAGRTDAGVHATHQVVHFDTSAERPHRAWLMGGNANLPGSVALRWVREVDESFSARFSATARSYRYVILSQALRPALLRDRVSWTYKALDAQRMHAAGQALLGEHDFTSFRAVACQAKHPLRTLHRLSVRRAGDYLYLDVEANAFLHHMVRNIAGTLMAIGTGERPPEWAAEVLAARDRTVAGITAPAEGLYLVGVRYPEQYGIPAQGALPAFA